MRESDRSAFFSALAGVCELYGKKASAELGALYWGALTAYELTDVLRALNLHAIDPDSGQFMPKPADIVRHISGSKQTRSLQAWSKVERAIRSIGAYQSVAFDDPIIHAVLEDMGGWIDLCQTKTEKDLEFRANEFDKRYQGYALQGGARDYPSRLIGMVEAENGRFGLPAPKCRLIGEREAAIAVLEHGREGGRPLLTGMMALQDKRGAA